MNWVNSTIGEYCPFIYGKGLPKIKRQEGKYPVYGSNGCVDYHNKFLVDGPGLIIGRKGSVGAVHLSEVPFWPIDTAFYVVKDSLGELRYTYYLLRSLGLEKMNSDSAVPGLNRENAHALKITIPATAADREVLGNSIAIFDKKISNNLKTNQNLEEMAQAIFKSWFVDFDPVQAKIKREQPVGMKEATAALFPESFVESNLGIIPEGWSEQPLGSLVDFMTGFAFKSKEFTDTGVRLARGDNVKEGRFHWGEKSRYWPNIASNIEKYQLKSGDILIGMDGSKVGKNWVRVNDSDLPCLLVQRVARLRGRGLIGSSMLEVIIGGDKFKAYVNNVKTGTSIPHISGNQIKEMPILFPNDGGKLFQEFEILLTPLAKRRELNNAQNERLSQLRDTLLPKLLSGEIELNQAKDLAEVD